MSATLNVSNSTNRTYDVVDYDFVIRFLDIGNGILICISIVGTTVNLFFLAAIFSSSELRSRLRNKIICSSFLLHLLNCLVILPIHTSMYFAGREVDCVFDFVFWNIDIIKDIVANWLLVMLIAVFIAQIVDFNPTSRLSTRKVTAGSAGLLAFPWLAALIIVPVVIHEYRKLYSHHFSDCLHVPYQTQEVFKSIDTALPLLLAIVLITAAAFLRYRRFTVRRSAGSIQFELMERGPEIDNILVYIIAVIVSILCDLLVLTVSLSKNLYIRFGIKAIFMYGTGVILSDSRAVLMPLVWLLFPDIRHRMKSWRPWHRPAPPIELTMRYQKEEE